MRMQSIIRAIYPAQCVACDAATDDDHGLCGPCWRETHFISGVICDRCGTPMQGDDPTEIAQCDDCLRIARPWGRGRSVMAYDGVGRKLALSLKHGDRTDLAVPTAIWMARAITPLLQPDSVIVPVPLHWVRMLRRRYNQSALLANGLAKHVDRVAVPDALLRPRATPALGGQGRAARFATLEHAIIPNPRRQARLNGQHVVLIDDVMASGATMAAATEACFGAGARDVDVLTLARAVKDT